MIKIAIRPKADALGLILCENLSRFISWQLFATDKKDTTYTN